MVVAVLACPVSPDPGDVPLFGQVWRAAQMLTIAVTFSVAYGPVGVPPSTSSLGVRSPERVKESGRSSKAGLLRFPPAWDRADPSRMDPDLCMPVLGGFSGFLTR